MAPKSSKKFIFKKNIFFCSFYVTLSLHAKNYDCTSIGVSCGQYKDKEGKKLKKTKKGPKNAKNENFEKRKKNYFPIALKIIFSKNQGSGSKTVTCSLITDTHTHMQTDRHQTEYRGKPFQGFRSSSLQPIITERSNTSRHKSSL